jgi:transcriptional regulator with XRE-family HTH domain
MQAVSDEQALKNIAANVIRLRGDRSQYWLAKEVGTYPANIARIENGENMPGAGLLSRLAEALGVSIQVLLDPPPTSNRGRRAS